MELQKELLKKHLKNRGLTKYSMNAEQYGACLDAISEALSMSSVEGQSEQLKAFLLYIQENAPNYRTKQLKPDQVIKAYLESL